MLMRGGLKIRFNGLVWFCCVGGGLKHQIQRSCMVLLCGRGTKTSDSTWEGRLKISYLTFCGIKKKETNQYKVS